MEEVLYDGDSIRADAINLRNYNLVYAVIVAYQLSVQSTQGFKVPFQLRGQVLHFTIGVSKGGFLILNQLFGHPNPFLQAPQFLLRKLQLYSIGGSLGHHVQSDIIFI